MPNLVIDVGNSFVKAAVFNGNTIVYNQKTTELNTENVQQLIAQFGVTNVIVSTVKDDTGIDESVIAKQVDYLKFSRETPIPISNQYETPDSLGLDRLAGMVAAHHLFANQEVMVIDAGTCITYDTVNEQGLYKGGSISPGIKMRLDAMHHFTAKLPWVSSDVSFSASFGRNSIEALQSGAFNGAVYEVEGFINRQIQKNSDSKLILCGGDSAFFDTKFKNSIFANLILHEPNLVLIGLNTVVNYQHDLK